MMDRSSNSTPRRLAFVQSSWHPEIVGQSRKGFLEVATADVATVEFFEVPGAYEIPLHAQRLANSQRFEAIIAAGLVVDGGIYRHDFVANAVISGLMRVQLDTGVPVFSCVLTPHQFHEHDVHLKFFTDHMVEKGREAAEACLATLASFDSLPSPA